MSVATNSYYTDSYQKRPDITGAPDQVFKFNNFLEYLLGGIKANTISAIGTLNSGSMCIQYLYAPQVHYDFSGTPLAIVGNSSNKKANLALLRLTLHPFASSLSLTRKQPLINILVMVMIFLLTSYLKQRIGRISPTPSLVLSFPTFSFSTLGRNYLKETSGTMM